MMIKPIVLLTFFIPLFSIANCNNELLGSFVNSAGEKLVFDYDYSNKAVTLSYLDITETAYDRKGVDSVCWLHFSLFDVVIPKNTIAGERFGQDGIDAYIREEPADTLDGKFGRLLSIVVQSEPFHYFGEKRVRVHNEMMNYSIVISSKYGVVAFDMPYGLYIREIEN